VTRSATRIGVAAAVFVASIVLAGLAAGCGEKEPRPAARVARSDPAPAVLWISDVAVLDVERGERVPHRDVRIEDGRIAAIERGGSRQPPPEARVLDGTGATLVPGLIDMHGHIYASSAPSWQLAPPDPDGNLVAYLYCGVTTVFDPGDGSGDATARRARVASGEQLGPHIFTTGPIHTAPNGHPISVMRAFAPWWIAWYLAPRAAVAVGSEEEAAAAVDAVAEDGVDAVKIVIDSIPLDAPEMPPAVARAIVERARSHGLRTVAHIGTTADAITAADAGVALWVHGVYKERIPDDEIATLAGYGIPMVATIEVFDSYARLGTSPRVATALERETVPAEVLDAFYPIPEDFDQRPLESWLEMDRAAAPARIENTRRLHEAGVTILAGSDTQSGVFAGAALHRELANLVRAGFTPSEAIRAATLDAARFLADGESPDFGAVAVGQRADLLIVEGDPTRNIAALGQIREVILAGVPLVRTPIAEAEVAAR